MLTGPRCEGCETVWRTPSLCVKTSGVGYRSLTEKQLMKKKKIGNESEQFYAVFDGHRGAEAAIYTAIHFQTLVTQVMWSCTHAGQLADRLSQDVYPPQAMRDTFESCDRGIVSNGIEAGTTALIALLLGSQLYTANCGDTRYWNVWCLFSPLEGVCCVAGREMELPRLLDSL